MPITRSAAYALYALYVILMLQEFGMLGRVIELYGTRTHFYRCLLLGDWVSFHEGKLYVTDRECWSATWNGFGWDHN
jgi:hypothetical protein